MCKQECMERNYGIDALRILSMVMVVNLHVLRYGGLLEGVGTFTVKYHFLWILEIATYCAVNCYALVSGYVGYNKGFKLANIFYLYFQVIYYKVIITGIFCVLGKESLNVSTVFKSLIPFSGTGYWYFSAYFCMFFFIPFLNELLVTFKEEMICKLVLSIFFVFSILPTLVNFDVGNLNGGCSVAWLVLLYLVGGYIKKARLVERVKKKKALLFYVFLRFNNLYSESRTGDSNIFDCKRA